jgi:zinc protease
VRPRRVCSFWFKAGSALESEDHFGIAHFLEHMFFKGTASRPDHMIAHEVESFGGEINAFTSFDYTCYYINTPTNHLGQTVEILADMVANPLFAEEHLVPEREVVNEEYKRSQDSSSQYSFQFIQANSFTGGYSHPILGNPGTILNFTRKQLIQYRSKFYNNQNSMLVIAGDLSKKMRLLKLSKNTNCLMERSVSLKNLHLKKVEKKFTSTIKIPNKQQSRL